jgi:hypothetical protein
MSFIKRKYVWAKQKPLFWFNILLALITAVMLLRTQLPVVSGVPSDLRLRLWGMALQLIGAYTVWVDLSSTARNFGKGDVISSTLKWLKVGILGRPTVLEASGAAQGNSSSSGRITQRCIIDSSASIEERLAVLEKNFQFIEHDIHGAFKEISAQGVEVRARLDEQKSHFTREIKSTHLKISEGFTGNYGTLLFGVSWLCVGIFFASVAPELAKAMNGQWNTIWLAL